MIKQFVKQARKQIREIKELEDHGILVEPIARISHLFLDSIEESLAIIEKQNHQITDLKHSEIKYKGLFEHHKTKEEDLFYTLSGVMLSVDKWLDDKELQRDEVNRAIIMREKTLKITEELKEENSRLRSFINMLRETLGQDGLKDYPDLQKSLEDILNTKRKDT